MRSFTLEIEAAPLSFSPWRVKATLQDDRAVLSSVSDRLDYDFIPESIGTDRAWPNPELLALDNNPFDCTKLGRLVFGPNAQALFDRALARDDKPLHVILVLHDTGLEVLAWRRLCCKGRYGVWQHIRLNRYLPFAIHVAPENPDEVMLIDRRDFRALIVAADPGSRNEYELRAFDAAAVVVGLRKAMGATPSTVLTEVRGSDGPPTLRATRRALGQQRFSWPHIVCHGRTTEAGQVLYLLDEAGKVKGVTEDDLVTEFREARTTGGLPHFACETAHPATGAVVGDLGRRLVREAGLPAVVAMTEAVSTSTATALCERFYQHLAIHGTVDLALNAASADLAESRDITVPTLFSRLGGSSLCLESEFLDFDEVRARWSNWLAERRAPQLLFLREVVPSPLCSDWERFMDVEPFQQRVEAIIDRIAETVSDDSPTEWRVVVRKLRQFRLNRPCDELVTAILPLVKDCITVRKKSLSQTRRALGLGRYGPNRWSESDPLNDLLDVLNSRRFECCFPIVAQFGSGMSFFVNHVIDSFLSQEDRRVLVLPVRPEPSRRLEEAILASACDATRGLRTWKHVEELERDLTWHDAKLVIVLDDLHLYLDPGHGAGSSNSGSVHADLEHAVKRLSRFGSIRWLVTIQDSHFDKVADQSSFWSADGLGGADGPRDVLLGWLTLNDRVGVDETGFKILERNSRGEEADVPDIDVDALRADANLTQKRYLSLPLVAAVLTSNRDLGEEVTAVSVNRESLVNKLLQVFYDRHGATSIKPYVNKAIFLLSEQFFTRDGVPNLETVDRWLSPLGNRASPVLEALKRFGLLGTRAVGDKAIPETTAVVHQFDPVWYSFRADLRFKTEALPLEPPDSLWNEFGRRLGSVVDPDHREGVGEFALTLILERLKRAASGSPRPHDFAARFAATFGPPNSAAFRAACYEPPDFQVRFARSFRRERPERLDPRTQSGLLLFVDSAWEVRLSSSVALIAQRFPEFPTGGLADLCSGVLSRRKARCEEPEEIWRSLSRLSGCEILSDPTNEAYWSRHAFTLAELVVERLFEDSEMETEDAFERLLRYLNRQRTRAEEDHARYERRPRSPYFFRECLLHHFCDWHLSEHGLSTWHIFNKRQWYGRLSKDRFGSQVAHEMEQEANKAFGRWYRRGGRQFDPYRKQGFRRLLFRLSESAVSDDVISAYFMLRHTTASELSYGSTTNRSRSGYRTHFVDQDFEPLLRRFEQLCRDHRKNEIGERLSRAMAEYPIMIRTL
jgi:hypothetical protein